MSEAKPQAGQWLVMNDDPDERVFLVGKTADGKWVIEWEDGSTSVDGYDLADWRHEPSCTGWDWEPDPFEVPDERANHYLAEQLGIAPGVSKVEEAAESWPKYYRGKNWAKTDAFVRFDGPGPDQSVMVLSDGRQVGGQPFKFADVPDSVARHSWYELTEQEAKALVESPDDWVIQDRVPFRSGIDESRWVFTGLGPSQWKNFSVTSNPSRVYGVDSSGDLYEIRCRRKDLPPLPPTAPPADIPPTTIPVRLWVSHRLTFEGGDWPIRCGKQIPSGVGHHVEIKVGANGFYIEKE